jgi:hypothetical protein
VTYPLRLLAAHVATGRIGRAAARHADPKAGSLLATSRLSTVQLPSMAGVGATQAIRQAILAAWKSATAVCGVYQVERQVWGLFPTLALKPAWVTTFLIQT